MTVLAQTDAGSSGSGLLGVVVVTYNSAHVLGACLENLRQYDLSIVVVDNASVDASIAIAASFDLTLIANKENRGFAAAANQGIAALDTPYTLLLNPDVVLTSSPSPLIEYFRQSDIGAVAATLLGEDGAPQSSFQFRRLPGPWTLIFETLGLNRLWPSNPVNRRYRYRDLRWEAAGAVEQPAGAFLLLRKDAWRAVGGFDERFWPVWFEDVDYCLQLLRNHYRVWRVPTVAGVHAGGHSIHELGQARRQLYWYRSLLLYASKHFSSVWVRVIGFTVVVGALSRALLQQSARSIGIRGVNPVLVLALKTVLHGRPPSSRPVSSTLGNRHET